ncbi:MAG: DUF1641 domain-containing protein [Haloarculaceae archaeon]
MSDQTSEAESEAKAESDAEPDPTADTEPETAPASETGTDADAERARRALETAVAENPEEVVAFVERLGLLNELLDTTALATSAMDDEMVMRLAGTSSLLAESADGLATPETARLAASVGENAEDLEGALETVLRLERAGTLEELAELADAATLLTSAMDDEMVMRLARTGSSLGEVADTAAEPETARGIQRLLDAVGEAGGEPPEPVGAVGLLGALRDPEVKRGMGFLVALARGLGRVED